MTNVCNPNWKDAKWSVYRYEPSAAPAIVFCLLFMASTVLHLWQMWKTKAWFLTALVLGCLFEGIGYAARTVSAQQDPGCWTLMPYIISTILVLLGPTLFSATIYMTLGRIVALVHGDKHVLIKQHLITRVFVTGDAVCLFLQCAAGGLIAGGRNNDAMGKIGNGVIIASLLMQTLWFLFFIAVAGLFHRRMNQAPTLESQDPKIRWRSYLHTLYFAGTLVVIRSLFRAIEFAAGRNGALMTSEVYLYVFDAMLMFIVVAFLHWRHPGEIGVLGRGGHPEVNGLRLFALRAKNSTL